MEEVLRVENAVKYYGRGKVVTKALDGISFTVDAGEFVAIMGASGSGKSTLLNVISTIDRVSAGRIFVGGRELSGMKEDERSAFRRDHLGFIFQEYNLLETLTAGENISLPLHLKHVRPQQETEALERMARVFGLSEQLGKFPYELSGGQQQRIACARALIAEPDLVLADEPTGALDSSNSRNLMATFETMNRSLGSTILMVTHDPLVGSYAGRVLFLKDGRIWSEAVRGDRSRQTMYDEILSVLAALGGYEDVC